MADASSLASVASIIAAFGVAMLFFRIQRELKMDEDGERMWIPWADRLLVGATVVCLLLVIGPMLVISNVETSWVLIPPSAAAAACVLVVGYIPSILAHYRIILANGRTGPRPPVELPEKVLVLLSVLLAA